jgi:large subunit ribosomal protein L21
MFAVIKTGGKQYRVAADEVISIDKIAGNPGEIVEFGNVLLVGGESMQVGTPTVAGATVAGEVIEQGRGAKIIAFKKRRRKNSRRKRGHRQEFTLVRITEILTDGRRPTARPKPEAEAKAQPSDVAGEAAEGQAEPGTAPPAAKRKAPGTAKAKPKAAARTAAKKPARPAKEKGASKSKKK